MQTIKDLRRISLWRIAGVFAAAIGFCAMWDTASAKVVHSESYSFSALPALDEPTLAERLAWIEAEMEKARLAARTPGAGVAVIYNGEIVLLRGFGLADIEAEREATGETRFAVGSTTKAFTATLVTLLETEGVMSLDDHPRTYLPEFRIADAEANEQVTIRDLLCHRTGHAAMTQVWYGMEHLTPAEVLGCYSIAELLHPFRTTWNYSNESFLVAGLASAAAVGTDWNTLLQERIFEPLGMTTANSTFAAAQADADMAKGYFLNPHSDSMEVHPMRKIDHVAPAGSINASAADMARWVQFQLGRGMIDGRQVAPREAIEETWKKHSQMTGAIAYGLGWMIAEWEGKRLITHAGGIDGYTAEVAFLPDDGFGVVVLTNHFGTPFTQQAREIALRGLFKDHPGAELAAVGHEDFERFIGVYIANFGPFREAEMPVSVQNGRLAVLVPGQTTYELKSPNPDGKRPFVITDSIAVTFNEDAQGAVYSFTFHQGGMNFEVFRQGATAPIEIDLAEAGELCGVYRIDAGGPQIDVEVLIQNNRLAVNVPGQMVYPLFPPDDEGWWVFRTTETIRVRFDRDESGHVVSMTQRQSGNDIVMQRVGDPADAQDLPTVAELLAYISETLDPAGRIQSLELEGSVVLRHQGLHGSFSGVADAQGRIAQHVDLGDGRITHAWFNGTSGTSRVYAVTEDIALTQGMIHGLAMQCPLTWMRDWRDVFDRVRVIGRENREHGAVFVVECRKGSLAPTMVEVDIATGRIQTLQITNENYLGMPVEMTLKLDDWKPVEGVLIAHRWEIQVAMAGSTVLSFETVRANVHVANEMFEPLHAD